MRIILLAVPLLLAGCSGSPQGLGITGPGTQSAAPAPTAETPPTDPLDDPNVLQSGGRYGPSYTPTTGSGHFWGYN